jgi:tRNA-Thr(GGU) m(6)t(6)A37 methyltransferase TsaA
MSLFQAEPVAFVHNSVKRPRPHGWEDVESRVELVAHIGPETLAGLEGFSHVLIIFWLDRLGDQRPQPLTIEIGDDPQPRGILATRSQLRPTPIGCSAVRVLAVAGSSLYVRGLDAIDGTPVLDIKPYIPDYDCIATASVPAWIYGSR